MPDPLPQLDTPLNVAGRTFDDTDRALADGEDRQSIYASSRYENLRVIDKPNGGKSDALNAGLGLATGELVCAVDADSLLESDSLLRAVQPFIDQPERCVAVGGTVRVGFAHHHGGVGGGKAIAVAVYSFAGWAGIHANRHGRGYMAALAAQRGLVLQVGHIFRFDPATEFIKEYMASGQMGAIHSMSGNFSGFKRPRMDGGVTISDAIHFIDFFNYLMDRIPGQVLSRCEDLLGRGMDDMSWIWMDYEGIPAVVEAGKENGSNTFNQSL